MLLTMNSFVGTAVMSLQTGRQLAVIGEPIINPHDLSIMAFYVSGSTVDFNPAVLFVSDIREIGHLGIIVDSSDNITSPEGMVRLEEIIGYGFRIFGLKAIDDHKHKLGVVENFTFDPNSFHVEQILVKPGFGRRLSVMNLTISRQQVIEVSNQRLLVKAPDRKVIQKVVKQAENPNSIPFENPFRKPEIPLSESKNTD